MLGMTYKSTLTPPPPPSSQKKNPEWKDLIKKVFTGPRKNIILEVSPK